MRPGGEQTESPALGSQRDVWERERGKPVTVMSVITAEPAVPLTGTARSGGTSFKGAGEKWGQNFHFESVDFKCVSWHIDK